MQLHTRRGINFELSRPPVSPFSFPAIAAPPKSKCAMCTISRWTVRCIGAHSNCGMPWPKTPAGACMSRLFPTVAKAQGITNPLPLLTSGELEFFTLAGNGLSALVPPADVQATPFAFTNPAQVYQALDGDLGDYLREETRAKGLYLLPAGCFENGMHQLTSNVRPIRTRRRYPRAEAACAGIEGLSGFLPVARRRCAHAESQPHA